MEEGEGTGVMANGGDELIVKEGGRGRRNSAGIMEVEV